MQAKCALVQMNFSTDVRDNVERATARIAEAASAGAEIVCFPELATSIYFCTEIEREHYKLAESVKGPSMSAIAEATRDAGIYVVFPFYERDEEDDQLYNTAAFLNRRGEVTGRYRKNIIPLTKFPGEIGIEKYYFRPGNLGYPVFETDLGIRVGVTICFERHFPESGRSLALNGADLIFVPTATPAGKDMWEVELRATAIANLLWVAGVNRVQRDVNGSDMDFYGKSLFSAPSGEIVAAAGEEEEEILYAVIDTEQSQQLREEWGFFRDRRPELYGAITRP
jgi:N-carbamoylputrescine amidase